MYVYTGTGPMKLCQMSPSANNESSTIQQPVLKSQLVIFFQNLTLPIKRKNSPHLKIDLD